MNRRIWTLERQRERKEKRHGQRQKGMPKAREESEEARERK